MATVKHHARQNQHTRRRANRNVKENRDAWREKLKVSHLMNRLADCGDGKVELEPSQIKAIEILLDRVVPRLSAVEQTQVNELDQLNRAEILERIRMLLAADPSLLPELVALSARDTATQPSVIFPPRPKGTSPG